MCTRIYLEGKNTHTKPDLHLNPDLSDLPPIQLFGVEGRYACALYSAASKLKQLDVVEKDLIKFQGILKTDLRLQEFIRNPILKRSLKVTAVKEIAAKVPLSVPSTNLLALLAENGRLKAVNTIINSFKTIMAAHRGEVVCEVTTAKGFDHLGCVTVIKVQIMGFGM
uniref:Oligomycin sensitivity conferral protein n=2 Tax=Timema TaxID=61471 RepID=A0A7R9AL60_TIMSH|nr:unnamed protein product [Timema shepardi]